MTQSAPSPRQTIVVLGATGRQGGAVAAALCADARWTVRALTRSPRSPRVGALQRLGVEIALADMDDAASMATAFRGAHGVFSVQATTDGPEREVERGVAVARAASQAGVRHFVYASVGGAERGSGVPHFESKWRVETYLRSLDMAHSIVRPTFFMENFSRPGMRAVLTTLIRTYLPAGKPLQMVSVRDVGRWVADAFAEPDAFMGVATELAGDALTLSEIRAAFRSADLWPGLAIALPPALRSLAPQDVIRMFEWFGASGYQADLRSLRSARPELLTLEQWAEDRHRHRAAKS